MKQLTHWHRLASVLLACTLLCGGLLAVPARAGETEQNCATKYPILLVHGAGFRDMKLINYWGRIPAALKDHGAQVFYGGQDAWGSYEDNAQQLKTRVEEILAETGAKKVNIIAHSKGGVDARYMISSLGMAGKVASLTTISSPHHGSETMAIAIRQNEITKTVVSFFADLWFKVLGDDDPAFRTAMNQMGTEYMKEFNKNNPNAKGVYYQSWAGAMTTIMSDILMGPPFTIVSRHDGRPNDGMVSVESASWGNFRGIITTPTNRGVSHLDEVDFRRSRFTAQTAEGTTSDIRDFYVEMVAELKGMGY